MTRNRVLWGVQGILAAVFLFAGGMKLTTPAELLAMPPFSGEFIQFIGVCEVLGALGLLLPGLTGIRRELTVLAAGGLVLIMLGATLATLAMGAGGLAGLPALLGVLAAGVAHGRRQALSGQRAVAAPRLQLAN